MWFRTNTAYGLFAVALLGFGGVLADEIDDTLEEAVKTPSAATPSSAAVKKPSFSPLAIKAPFYEQFTEDWESRWKISHAKKQNDKSGDEEWAYVGEWSVEEPTVLKGIEGDKGLVVKNVAAHHAISAKFPTPVDPKDKNLVVQYEVKLQGGLDCGGAYLKLLRENKDLHLEEFSNASPYVIMFGPDKCGATNKVHFIFNHKNPKTGEYEEKHLKAPPMAKITKLSTLYTLIVKPDQTYELKIDGKSAKKGSLLVDFSPAVNPEKEIDDPNDKKPADWVDTARIEDPDAKKPDDWDEDAPYEIVDEDAKKPEDWLEDEPQFIPDPTAEKPEDWDDDEDGDWIAPTVPNPKCEEVSGCGKWEKPMKVNPDYKGKWTPPTIDNPAYKGPWAPRKIANPDFFEDKTPSNFEPIGALGFELWTMNKDILFDNIYVGHSIEDAEKLEKETWAVKRQIEDEEDKANQPKTPEPTPVPSFKEDPVNYMINKFQLFLAVAQQDPVGALKEFPEVVGTLVAAVVTVFALLAGLISVFSAPTPVQKPAKNSAPASDEKPETKIQEAAEAESSGNEKPKATRRTSKKA
ncbi:Calreticulin-domain-containing protein [Ascodesmis nigricans]|uniref:Calreticulin-domain-containing protein n=1 Tax=Ascodesmis nigricans TaxID=341454 RepID=A0A4S2MT64_9PEZI|nr:Calreticulin-domain-containing protein [Ascodesmis nigricans]